MKKIILLALTALMIGCGTESSHYPLIYLGDKWEILKINDSTYLMIPRYEEYHKPCTLKLKQKQLPFLSRMQTKGIGRVGN